MNSFIARASSIIAAKDFSEQNVMKGLPGSISDVMWGMGLYDPVKEYPNKEDKKKVQKILDSLEKAGKVRKQSRSGDDPNYFKT